jgi:hypothetical protein
MSSMRESQVCLSIVTLLVYVYLGDKIPKPSMHSEYSFYYFTEYKVIVLTQRMKTYLGTLGNLKF